MTVAHSAPKICVLGVMTGTSCDALDLACVNFYEKEWNLLWTLRRPYPALLRKRVLEFQRPVSRRSVQSILELHRDLGEWYGRSLCEVIVHQKNKPDVIANHGQTVAHFPSAHDGHRKKRRRQGVTLQLGDPARVSWWTGLTVISNFRDGDLSAGGQGAPLVPLFHKMLSRKMGHDDTGVLFQNIGGIGNLTYIGPADVILAFDTGPGNLWIDLAAARVSGGRLKMDRDGRLARAGKIDALALNKILNHSFFKKDPPKSTGRDEFPFSYFLSKINFKKETLVATATAVTVESITLAWERWISNKGLPLGHIYLSGGGARNRFLVECLKRKFNNFIFRDLRQQGVNPDFLEAEAFAFLGWMSLQGKALGGVWTGADGLGPPGHLVPGRNWKNVLEKIQNFFSFP